MFPVLKGTGSPFTPMGTLLGQFKSEIICTGGDKVSLHLGFEFGPRSMEMKAKGGIFTEFVTRLKCPYIWDFNLHEKEGKRGKFHRIFYTAEAELVLVFVLMAESAIC